MEGREGDDVPSTRLSSSSARDSSCITSSVSSSFSYSSDYFDFTGCPPQSEYEEIPSRRWLASLFRSTPPRNQTPDPVFSSEVLSDRPPAQPSVHRVVPVGGGALNGGDAAGEEDGGGALGPESPTEDRCVGRLEDAAFVEEVVNEATSGSSGNLQVFFVLVLSGLVGGRIVATVLIVLWYSLVSSARSLWKSWKVHRSSLDALKRHGIRGGEEGFLHPLCN